MYPRILGSFGQRGIADRGDKVCLNIGLKTAGQEVVLSFQDLSQTPLSLSLFAALFLSTGFSENGKGARRRLWGDGGSRHPFFLLQGWHSQRFSAGLPGPRVRLRSRCPGEGQQQVTAALGYK